MTSITMNRAEPKCRNRKKGRREEHRQGVIESVGVWECGVGIKNDHDN